MTTIVCPVAPSDPLSPSAHVAHLGPTAPSIPSAHVAHLGPTSHVAHCGHCGPTHHAEHIIIEVNSLSVPASYIPLLLISL